MKDSLFEEPKEKITPQIKIFTVSQITLLIKTSLENSLPGYLTVSGELSNFRPHPKSGHCYFDLKDENSILPAVMWQSDFEKLKFKPENGLAVLAKGHVDVYPPQGKYQFYAETMQPAGMGALQLAFEQLKMKLSEQGLFAAEHKKELPKYPFRIGIITSKSGAALHDIVDSIYNRWPVAKLFFYDTPVQGEGAGQKIAAAIKDINRRNDILKLEVLIVGRGGGSMEDLWAFNEEIVARTIYNSKIPIISAVGHEIDFTIADFVADARASTPTKAGVLAVPDIKVVLQKLESAGNRIKQDIDSILKLNKQELKTILATAAFRNPQIIIQNREQMLDETQNELKDSAKSIVSNIRALLHKYFEEILRIEPHKILSDKKIALNAAAAAIEQTVNRIFIQAKMTLETQAGKLSSCNPKSVLGRGYSIAKNALTGKVITSPADINIGQILITELANEKTIESKVTKK